MTRAFFKRLTWLMRCGLALFFDFKIPGPERLRIFFERAGGAFIKLGQILALRQDFLPPNYINELLRLLNRVPEIDFSAMHIVFIEEMGKPVERFFSAFDQNPVASGSLAQVYAARLFNGEKVAVKIQRPGIKKIFETDFLLISFLAGILDFFRLFSSLKAAEVASEFINWTKCELNFMHEARNAAAIYEHSKIHPQTVIPKQYLDLTTSRVLIQEFIENGVGVEEILLKKITREELLKRNINPDEMADYLIKDEMRQYFIDGFFHADPHPANLIFLPGNRLAYLDFGIAGRAEENRFYFLQSLYGTAGKDIDLISRSLFEFAKKYFSEEINLLLQRDFKRRHTFIKVFERIKEFILEDFKKEIKKNMNPWFKAVENPESSIYQKSATRIFLNNAKLAEKYNVYFPREMILFFRTLSILDMIALQVSPDFDMIKALKSFFREYHLKTAEVLIREKTHEKEAGEKIIPMLDIDWEYFKEISFAEKEKMMLVKERAMELIFKYAEQHEEIRSMLKNLKF